VTQSVSRDAPRNGLFGGAWEVQLREPLGLPVQGAISVQLPPGRYTLFRRSSSEYELIPWHVPAALALHEIEELRCSGRLVVEGQWPSPTSIEQHSSGGNDVWGHQNLCTSGRQALPIFS
jgi:hypothetical protein